MLLNGILLNIDYVQDTITKAESQKAREDLKRQKIGLQTAGNLCKLMLGA